MNKKVITGFWVAGLSIRTNNSAEASEHGKIGKVWSEFFQSKAICSITERVGSEIYAVYTDYESDHTGDYTFVLGYKIAAGATLSEELAAVQIPDGEYAVITSQEGPVMRVVPAVWQKIWALTENELQGTRAYSSDFELYDHRAQDPSRAQVDVFVGLK